MARSMMSRHLAQSVEAGVITRQRRPGGVYACAVDSHFLPASCGVSHRREQKKIDLRKALRGCLRIGGNGNRTCARSARVASRFPTEAISPVRPAVWSPPIADGSAVMTVALMSLDLAPRGRLILAWDSATARWRIAVRTDDTWLAAETGQPILAPRAWAELPPTPPAPEGRK
jgi:hypothetical protein